MLPNIRKKLVALRCIHKDEKFTPLNLGCKRSQGKIPAAKYNDYLGKPSSRSYKTDQPIVPWPKKSV